jgi:RecA-family ATPase
MKSNTSSPVSWETIQKMLGLTMSATVNGKVSARQADVRPVGASIAELMQRPCIDGERTQHLTVLAGSLLAARFDEAECIERCLQWNAGNVEPLDDDKVIATCGSICASDRKNHPERYQHLLPVQPLFDLQAGRIDRYLQSNPPLRRWLLKDLVVLGRVGAIIAPGGSSKSQWLLQLAVGVATGIAVADHWEVGETGGVMVFFAEDDGDEIHRRIKRIQEHLQLAGHADKLASLQERLYIFSTIGTNTLLTKREPSGEVSTTVVVDRIAALAGQVPDLRLIVIDPCSRFRGGEENSNEDATRFVEALETLAKITGATVMLAHHTNKGSYNPDGEPGQGASRGASALTDGLRWQLNLNRPSDKQASAIGIPKDDLGRYVAATVTKSNYSAIPAPVLLERRSDGFLTAVTPAQAQQRTEQDAIVRILQVLQHTGAISARNLEEEYGGVGNALKMPKQQVRDVVKMAVARGFIRGGDRKPLEVTDMGHGILKCFPGAAAIATRSVRTGPRKNTQ